MLVNDETPAGSARRTALFGDTKYSPNQWSQFLKEGLLFLGCDYQLFLNRGKPPPPKATPTAVAVVPVPAPSPGTPTRLIKKPIFKSTQQSPIHTVLDSFAADGSFSQAVEAGVVAAHIPEIFRSSDAPRPIGVAPQVAVSTKQSTGLVNRLKDKVLCTFGDLAVRNLPTWILETSGRWAAWWKRERINKVVEACLPRREVDVLIIEGIFNF